MYSDTACMQTSFVLWYGRILWTVAVTNKEKGRIILAIFFQEEYSDDYCKVCIP
jgi:hypothetical protein